MRHSAPALQKSGDEWRVKERYSCGEITIDNATIIVFLFFLSFTICIYRYHRFARDELRVCVWCGAVADERNANCDDANLFSKNDSCNSCSKWLQSTFMHTDWGVQLHEISIYISIEGNSVENCAVCRIHIANVRADYECNVHPIHTSFVRVNSLYLSRRWSAGNLLPHMPFSIYSFIQGWGGVFRMVQIEKFPPFMCTDLQYVRTIDLCTNNFFLVFAIVVLFHGAGEQTNKKKNWRVIYKTISRKWENNFAKCQCTWRGADSSNRIYTTCIGHCAKSISNSYAHSQLKNGTFVHICIVVVQTNAEQRRN